MLWVLKTDAQIMGKKLFTILRSKNCLSKPMSLQWMCKGYLPRSPVFVLIDEQRGIPHEAYGR